MSEVFRTDVELVEICLAGNLSAFACLYDRHAGLVRVIALGAARDQSDIDDLTQEAFLRAFQNLGKLRRPDRFPSWLAGIARQVIRERSRKRGFLRLADHADPAEVSVDSTTEDLRELVARLPEAERIAVSLFFLNGDDVITTAAQLQRSRAGTYLLIKQAVARLAKWWKADESEKVKS